MRRHIPSSSLSRSRMMALERFGVAKSGWGLMVRARLRRDGGCCGGLPRLPVLDGGLLPPAAGSAGCCFLLWELPNGNGAASLKVYSIPSLGATCVQRLVNWWTRTPNLLTLIWDDSKGSTRLQSGRLHCVAWPFQSSPAGPLTSLQPVLILPASPVSFLDTNPYLRVWPGNPDSDSF